MRRHAAFNHPNECCGALLGQAGEVCCAWPLENVAVSPTREYRVSARAFFEAEAQAEQQGLRVLGFFHSHPHGAARPSHSDIEQAVPGYFYVILSSAEQTAWFAVGAALQPCPLIISPR